MSSKDKLLTSAQKNLQKGQIAKAIKDYQQIVDLDPKDMRNRQKLAELLCRAGMNAESLTQYEAVAGYYGDNGFYLKAIAVYKQMQKLDPGQVGIYHRLAELNVKQGLVGNALAEYRNLVGLLERNKLFSEAVGVLQRMAELEPDNLNIKIKIAEGSAQAGQRELARAELDIILDLLREARDYSRMVRVCELFIPLFPDDLSVKVGFSEALVRMGDVGQGLHLLKNLLRENPGNRLILNALALGYRESEDFENEQLTYLHLLKQTPGDLELREALVRACLDGGENRRALAELDEWKGAFFDAGRTVALKIFYQELLEIFPDSEQIQRALALIGRHPGDEENRLCHGDSTQLPAVFSAEEGAAPGAAAGEPSTEPVPEDLGPFSASLPATVLCESLLNDAVPVLPAEEMELELELELDHSLLEAESRSVDLELTEEADDTLPAEAILTGVAPEEVLEELEELEDVVELGELLSDPDTAAESVGDIQGELEEAEFYLQQGLLDDAERVCRHILETDPNCPTAREKLTELAARRQHVDCHSAENALFDWPAEISPEDVPSFLELQSAQEDGGSAGEDKLFNEFVIGAETPIDADDSETHYNLGIAYKEMGLLDEAVAEFDRSMKNPGRMLDSLVLKGTCLFAKGEFDQAERVFKNGLGYPGLNTTERVSLHYEMGLLYEAWGRPLEALDCFQAAADGDLFFRSVGEKLVELRKMLGLDVNAGKEEIGGKGNRGRVSYI